MTGHPPHILSVHFLRRRARSRERYLQPLLELRANTGRALPPGAGDVPVWARGVRVEKAGLFQWAVVATEERGH
jgi:hypothetical protein